MAELEMTIIMKHASCLSGSGSCGEINALKKDLRFSFRKRCYSADMNMKDCTNTNTSKVVHENSIIHE